MTCRDRAVAGTYRGVYEWRKGSVTPRIGCSGPKFQALTPLSAFRRRERHDVWAHSGSSGIAHGTWVAYTQAQLHCKDRSNCPQISSSRFWSSLTSSMLGRFAVVDPPPIWASISSRPSIARLSCTSSGTGTSVSSASSSLRSPRCSRAWRSASRSGGAMSVKRIAPS